MEPLLGSHMSIAEGLHLALERGAALGCPAIGMFCKSSNQWKAKDLSEADAALFRKRRKELKVKAVVAHASYLINAASPAPALLEQSRTALRIETERCEALGVESLVLHPGAHMGAGMEKGIEATAASLDAVHAATRGFQVKILLEIMAGQGSCVGCRLEDLKGILERVREPERLGVCLDTCHLFASGYDIRTPEGWEETMDLVKKTVGLKAVKAWHANDSKKALGSHVDRHEHIGRGLIGLGAFRRLMNDARFAKVPKILETEKEGDMDPVNLATLRRLVKKC